MKEKTRKIGSIILVAIMLVSTCLTGCNLKKDSSSAMGTKQNPIEIELVQYKPEAVKIFEKIEKKFNSTHDGIKLKIESPNDAMTILKTRFTREDYPDIIGIGGDVNYSNFVDANILKDISDYKGINKIQKSYVDTIENLEFIPTKGTYGVPYVANAAGILYNREIFEKYGWSIPNTWDELMELCKKMEKKGILPFYFGFKDTWTTMAPWNALAVNLTDVDVCNQVNQGKTTFKKEYKQVAQKMLQFVKYGEKGALAYGYNDACTAFAKGQAAMFPIGSYAVPQILSVNPKMKIDSFVMPANNNQEKNKLNSGVDLQFCITKKCKNKKAAYEVLDFLLKEENVQMYIDDQNAVPCEKGNFDLPTILDGVKTYIKKGEVVDFQDHHYPADMGTDSLVQTFLVKKDVNKFLDKFDRDWTRYNRDIIKMQDEYNKRQYRK